jgi:enterochelin esterase-like enzyme
MMKLKLFFFLFILFYQPLFAEDTLPIPSSGTIKRLKLNSKFIGIRTVDVWLPESYTTAKKYSVLYMQDGQMLFDSSHTWNKLEWGVDETLTRLINQNKIQACIVVGIWNAVKKRRTEYFPAIPYDMLSPKEKALITFPDSAYDSQRIEVTGPQSDNYLKFLVNELKPYIDSTFSTYTDRQHTCIAGSSMGGLISLYAICEYPSVFGAAACISTHWPGVNIGKVNPVPNAILRYLKVHIPSPQTHRIYFDYGTLTRDAEYKPFQQIADQLMIKKGYTNLNWTTKEFIGDSHSEQSWSKRLAIPMEFLLKKTTQ